jgi:capsular polysaccharide biosynthesis protein
MIKYIKEHLKQALHLAPSDSNREDWLAHVRAYPRFESKPEPGQFDYSKFAQHFLRKLGQEKEFLRRRSGLFLPAPCVNSASPYKIWEIPGNIQKPTLPHSLLGQELHDTFFDYYPSFSSRCSFILHIPQGSFHGHDHTLFDPTFKPIDWGYPYWSLNCGLPGTLFRKHLPKAKKLCGSALVLSAPAGGDNIWHFLFDSLPKIKLIEDAGMSIDDFDHILIDSFTMPYVGEALDILGINHNKVLETVNHPLITSDQLTYISLGCLLPPDPWVLHWLRSVFLPGGATFGTRKIFISRAKATRRRLHDEEIIKDCLLAGGFEAICLENLTLTEQIKLMSEASAVVASHGAGLTNLVWCQPGTKIVELFAAEYVNVCYWNISCMLNLKYSFALGISTMAERMPPRAVLDMNRLQADQVFADTNTLSHAILRFTNS